MFNSETKKHDETNESFVKKFDRRRYNSFARLLEKKTSDIVEKKCFCKRDCAREVTLLKLTESW